MAIAYSYIRFSHPSQRAGDSYRRQYERAIRYCARTGLTLADDTLLDLGRSAFRGGNASHGALGKFIRAVESGVIKPGAYLLIEALDRLSRAPPTEAQTLLLSLINAGIVVVVLMDDDGAGQVYDKATLDRQPFALLDAVIKLYAAHEESRKKSDRFKRLFEGRRANPDTKIVGFAAPGWLQKAPDGKSWTLVPERADSVRRLFELAAEGLGSVALASRANREAWPSPGGRTGHWSQSYVRKILTNRATLGEYQPMRADRVERDDGTEKTVLVPAAPVRVDFFPPVVATALFNRVQATTQDKVLRGACRGETEHNNVLAGMLRCGTCGATMILKTNGRNSKYPAAYYLCASRHRGLTECAAFRAWDLLLDDEPRKYRKAKQRPSSGLLGALMLHAADRRAQEARRDDLRSAIDRDKAALVVAQAQQSRLVDAIKSSTVAVAILAGELEKASIQVGELSASILANERALASVAADLDDTALRNGLQAAQTAIRDPDAIEARRSLNNALRRVIDRVWLWPGFARVRLIGEPYLRSVPLNEMSVDMLMAPPPLPKE